MPDAGEMNANSPADAAPRLHSNNSPRRVLGDVSPNIRPAAAPGTSSGKPLTGNSLKRSFNAAMENGQGFRYFKKRKFSIDSPLSQMMTAEESADEPRIIKDEPLLPTILDHHDLPTIQQLEPTRPNTPTDDDGQDSSADRRSFSSLINYDPSSQTAPSSQQQSGPVPNGPSYAELLGLRLRVAMYKVRTNQTHVPFEELQVEESSPQHSASTTFLAEAESTPTQRPAPRLLPAPILRPTQYSSRTIHQPSAPQSPPIESPAKLPCGRNARTPTSARRTGPDEQELTSSIVKGHVAEGLLGLRNAV